MKTKILIKDYRGKICEFILPFQINSDELEDTTEGCYVSDLDEIEEGLEIITLVCD